MPPTLIGLAFHDGARPKHVPFAEYYDLTQPNHTLHAWKIHVQGSQVLLVSPVGWKPPGSRHDAEGVSTIVQIPRVRCDLYWSGVEGDLGALERWPVAQPKGEGKARP
jgi:hypothetical protein